MERRIDYVRVHVDAKFAEDKNAETVSEDAKDHNGTNQDEAGDGSFEKDVRGDQAGDEQDEA